jgi:hypothetical protein
MKYPKLSKFDEMFTPAKALDSITPFLNQKLVYWESCFGEGHLAKELIKREFKVVGRKDIDCLKEVPNNWDFLITNPPFSENKIFLKRAIELNKPFALLITLEHLGGEEAK